MEKMFVPFLPERIYNFIRYTLCHLTNIGNQKVVSKFLCFLGHTVSIISINVQKLQFMNYKYLNIKYLALLLPFHLVLEPY